MGVQDIGQLPVVARGDGRRPIGLLRRGDVVRAYSQAMLDRLEHQTQRPILRSDLQGMRVVELSVASGSPLAGRTVAELRLPLDTLVVAIIRGADTLMPRGDTQLQKNDCVQILVRDSAIAKLHEHLAEVDGPPPAVNSPN